MAILANRVKDSNSFQKFYKSLILQLRWILAGFFLILSFSFLYIPVSDKISSKLLEASGAMISNGINIIEITIDKLSWINLKILKFQKIEMENLQLKLEVARLNKISTDNQYLLQENSSLKKLMGILETEEDVYLPVKLLNYSLSSIRKTALIGAGTKDGIQLDQIVKNDNGLIGKIIEVSKNYAKVLLVNDQISRIPVILSSSKERGILVGNGSNATIIYLPDNYKIIKGEKVLTSGDGKIYPPGLEVGVLADVNNGGNVTVDLFTNLRKSEYVSVRLENLDNNSD